MKKLFAIRLEEELKERFQRVARREGRNASQVVRELMTRYVVEHDIAGYIDDLWSRTGDALSETGARPEDIDDAVRGVRNGDR